MAVKKKLIITGGFILTALIFRIWYLLEFSASVHFSCPTGPDLLEYHSWAEAICSGHFLWKIEHLHAPLYPFFLAALYKICDMNFFMIRLLQSLITAAGVGLLFFPLEYMSKDKKEFQWLPWVYLGLIAVYPPLIYYSCELLSEALLLPLLCTSIFMLYKADRIETENTEKRKGKRRSSTPFYIAAGAAAGLAAITHPISLLFIVIETAYLIIRRWIKDCRSENINWRKILKPGIVFAILAAVIILPICIHNAKLPNGSFSIQTNSGMNLYIGNNPDATGSCYLRPGKDWEKVRINAAKEAKKQGMSSSKYFNNKVVEYIALYPLEWIGLEFKKLVYTFSHHELVAGADLTPMREYTRFMRWSVWSTGLMMMTGLAGFLLIVILYPSRVAAISHLLVLGGSWLAALLITLTSGRYRMPLYPVLFTFSAGFVSIAAYHITNKFRYIDRKFLLTASGAVIAAALVVWLPTAPWNYKHEICEAELLNSEILISKNKLSEAQKCLEKALKAAPDAPRVYTLLGTVYLKQMNVSKAREAFLNALKHDSVNPDPVVNLALMYAATGDYKVAVKLFKKAYKFWPHAPMVLYNYGFFLINVKQYAAAKRMLEECRIVEPSNLNTINALGVVYIRTGNYTGAIQCFEKVLSRAPRDTGVLMNLAATYQRTGNLDMAKYYTQQVLQLQPDNTNARKFYESLQKSKSPQPWQKQK